MSRVLALTTDGNLTYCSAAEEDRGKGRCNHITHQEEGETTEAFISKINFENNAGEKEGKSEDKENNPTNFIDSSPKTDLEYGEISQDEINSIASKLDEIAGTHLTLENWKEVVNSLPPEKVYEITKIGFSSAPLFSIPISSEGYDAADTENKIYFANLPDYGIAGNKPSVLQMFDKIADTPVINGEKYIGGNYLNGLNERDYFYKQFFARDAMISKSVGTAKPGYTARKLFYAMSDIEVVDDCGGSHQDILHCKAPNGSVCIKCARSVQGGDNDMVKVGQPVGGWVSTNLSEGLTQLSMKNQHIASKDAKNQQDQSNIIMGCLDGWATNPIIEKMKECDKLEDMRNTLYEGLKEEYKKAGIKVDEFNLQTVSKKMTSYKYDPEEGKVRPLKEGETPTIMSMLRIGNSSNIFKRVELASAYDQVIKPVNETTKFDQSNAII